MQQNDRFYDSKHVRLALLNDLEDNRNGLRVIRHHLHNIAAVKCFEILTEKFSSLNFKIYIAISFARHELEHFCSDSFTKIIFYDKSNIKAQYGADYETNQYNIFTFCILL